MLSSVKSTNWTLMSDLNWSGRIRGARAGVSIWSCSKSLRQSNVFRTLSFNRLSLRLRNELQVFARISHVFRVDSLRVVSNDSLLLSLDFDDSLGRQLLLVSQAYGLIDAHIWSRKGRHHAAFVQPLDWIVERTRALLLRLLQEQLLKLLLVRLLALHRRASKFLRLFGGFRATAWRWHDADIGKVFLSFRFRPWCCPPSIFVDVDWFVHESHLELLGPIEELHGRIPRLDLLILRSVNWMNIL